MSTHYIVEEHAGGTKWATVEEGLTDDKLAVQKALSHMEASGRQTRVSRIVRKTHFQSPKPKAKPQPMLYAAE